MLTAYVDESGQEQDDWMFLAGYYGDEAAWERVADLWPKALGPQRKHLHVTDLKFRYQSELQMLERAGAIPQICGLSPIVGGIRQSDFKDLIYGAPEERVISGYVLCVWAMLFDTLRVLPEGERLEVVFEEQERYQNLAHIALMSYVAEPSPSDLLGDGRHKLARWRWAPKGSTTLLEVADYFAFALSKTYREPGSTKALWCQAILQTTAGRGNGAIVSREQVRKFINDGMAARISKKHKEN